MDLGALRVGDTFFAVQEKENRQGSNDVFFDMRVTKVGRKYITAERVEGGWPRDVQFSRETGWQKESYRPFRAHLSRLEWERDTLHTRRCADIARQMYNLSQPASPKKLTLEELTVLERLLGKMRA